MVFGLSTNFTLSLIALTVLGSPTWSAWSSARRSPRSARRMRCAGRVSAVHSLFTGTSNQLGAFESGVAAALLGTVPRCCLGGVGTIAVAGLWMLLFPELRGLGRFEE